MSELWELDALGLRDLFAAGQASPTEALMLDAIAGGDRRDPHAPDIAVSDHLGALGGSVAGMRIGVPTSWFFDRMNPEVQGACDDALQVFTALGCEIVPVDLPGIELAERAGWTIMAAESASYHEGTFDRLEDYDERFAERLVSAQFITALDYLAAQRYRSVVQESMGRAFDRVDVLFTPGTPATAPRLGEMVVDLGDETVPWLEVAARCTFPFNVTGMPALVLPAGFDRQGLPISMQLAGRPFDETTCLRLGHAFQIETGHHRVAPVLAALV